MPEHVHLGRLLVERGLVAPDELDAALEEQVRSNRSLGRVLIDMGVVREEDLVAALAQQVGYDFVDLTRTTIAPEAAALIPDALARRHHAIAIGWRDDRLVVAVADPSNLAAIDDIRAATSANLLPVVATRVAIDDALDALAAGEVPGRTRADPKVAGDPDRRTAGTLLVSKARDARATEVHVEAQRDDARIRYRIDGVLHDSDRISLDALAELRPSLAELASSSGEVALITLPTLHGETTVVRLLAPPGPPHPLDELGLGSDAIARMRTVLDAGHGALVVTGPAGSGVTSTLHALLLAANAPGRHLLAVEEPVERELEGVTQVIVGPDLPVVTSVRRALAARPDVMLIGELRDGATASVALDGALAGRLVLAGLASRDAASTPGRLLAMGLEPVLLAGALGAVVAQRLVRRLCDTCKESWTPSDAELDAVGWDEERERDPELRRAVGCDRCNGVGYLGVVPIAEVMIISDDLARLITMRANTSDIQKLAAAQGMRTLRSAGLALVRDGTTSLTEVARVL